MKTYLHGPMDYAKTLKLSFRVPGRGPAPARKKRYSCASSREEEDAQMCLCGKAVE